MGTKRGNKVASAGPGSAKMGGGGKKPPSPKKLNGASDVNMPMGGGGDPGDAGDGAPAFKRGGTVKKFSRGGKC